MPGLERKNVYEHLHKKVPCEHIQSLSPSGSLCREKSGKSMTPRQKFLNNERLQSYVQINNYPAKARLMFIAKMQTLISGQSHQAISKCQTKCNVCH